MPPADRVLVWLLRFVACNGLLALVAVVMPSSWMAASHEFLGLGKLPEAPIVGYLARSLSAFYALFGAIFLFVAADVERYRPLIRLLGAGFVGLGTVFLVVDAAVGLPWWWTASEGPFGVVVGSVMLWLTRPAPPHQR